MKLISWKEKYPERPKDADDFLLIMHEYEHAGNFDRLYASEQDLLTEEDFDNQIASIRLLGRDMAMIVNKDTAKVVRSILEDDGLHPRSWTKYVRVVGRNQSPLQGEKGSCHEAPKEFCC